MQVERAKKCLDFAATLYIVHSIICVCVSGFSRSFAWCALLAADWFRQQTMHLDVRPYHAYLRVQIALQSNTHNFRWLTIGVGLGITSVLGEWLCLQREMRDIVIGGACLPTSYAQILRCISRALL
jgi:Integral membrane protein S linking to the trans Golgi network